MQNYINQMLPATRNVPLVSVIMLTIDRWQYIGSAVSSVVRQTWQNWELIIIHDGDNTEVRREIDIWSNQDKRIKYYSRSDVGNIANALNYGLDRCTGEFVAILDDDDAWVDDRKLEIQVDCLCSSDSTQAVGGGAYVVDKTGMTKMVYHRPSDPMTCFRYGLLANPIIHSTVLVRRSVLKAIGGYDETLKGYQDWDVWLKIMRIGQILNIPDCFASYRVWDGGGSSSKTFDNAISALRIVYRHRDYPLVVPGMCVGVLLLIVSLVPSVLRRPLYQFATKIKKSIKVK